MEALTAFTNFANLLFLVPFKICKMPNPPKTHHIVESSGFKKYACYVLVLIVFLTGAADTRLLWERNLLESPDRAFARCQAFLIELCCVPVWFITFFRNRDRFQGLSALRVNNEKDNLWRISAGILIYLEGKFLLEQLYGDIIRTGWDGTLKYYGGLALYNTYVKDNDDLLTEEELRHWGIWLCAVGYTVLMNLFRQIEHLTEAFVLIGALIVYKLGSKFSQDILRDGTCIEMGLNLYIKLKQDVHNVNTVFKAIVLFYTIGMVPVFVWCVFGMFETNGFHMKLYYFHQLFMHSLVLLVAAEAERKISTLSDWVLSKLLENPYGTGSGAGLALSIAHREIMCGSVGLKCGNFVTITYGFIAMASSSIVAYAVLMLQLQVDKYRESIGNSTSLG